MVVTRGAPSHRDVHQLGQGSARCQRRTLIDRNGTKIIPYTGSRKVLALFRDPNSHDHLCHGNNMSAIHGNGE